MNTSERTIEQVELEIAEAETYLDMLVNATFSYPEEVSDTKEHITSLTWELKKLKAEQETEPVTTTKKAVKKPESGGCGCF